MRNGTIVMGPSGDRAISWDDADSEKMIWQRPDRSIRRPDGAGSRRIRSDGSAWAARCCRSDRLTFWPTETTEGINWGRASCCDSQALRRYVRNAADLRPITVGP